MGETADHVTLDSIREAARGIDGIAVRTPLQPVPLLSSEAGVPVYLKLENLQPTGAFKLRGAWTFVRRLPEEARGKGIVTYSSGNHGQAIAFVALRVGIRAVVVMPETAPAAKIEGVKRWGGEVHFAGTTSEDRFTKAMAMAESEGLTPVPPYDHHDIIAGQGTVGLEILEDLPEVTNVAVPVGGGGLLAGIATAISALQPAVRVTGVEPEGSAALNAALAAGRPVRLDKTQSIADGLLPLSVGRVTFSHVQAIVDGVKVPDRAIAEATHWLHTNAQVLAETSGAATTAALRSGVLRPTGPTVLVVSGGNVDPAVVEALADA